MRLRLSATQQIQFSYTAAHAAPPPPNIISEYAYNYAAQNAIFGWNGTLPGLLFGKLGRQITAHTQGEHRPEDRPDGVPTVGTSPSPAILAGCAPTCAW